MSEPLIIVGNGMATMRLVEELSTRALEDLKDGDIEYRVVPRRRAKGA